MLDSSLFAPADLAASSAPPASLASVDAAVEAGRAALARGAHAAARDFLTRAVELDPRAWQALVALAELLLQLDHPDAARACIEQALNIDPAAAHALVQLAGRLRSAGRAQAAELVVRMAALRHPTDAVALNELALSLQASGEDVQAQRVWQAALRLAPEVAELHANLGEALHRRGEATAATVHYRQAVALRPAWADVWNNLGLCLRAGGDMPAAIDAFRRALCASPDHRDAGYNLGNALFETGDKAAARAAFARVCDRFPDNAQAHYGLATAITDADQAHRHLQRALALRPDFPQASVELACNRLRVCDWSQIDALCARVEDQVARGSDTGIAPFLFMQISADASLQQRCARDWSRYRVAAPQPARAPAMRRTRLRVGYVSGDFREHAVGHLVADLFAAHDHARFEILAYSSGPDDGSPSRAGVVRGADRFRDVRELGDTQLAALLAADELDVLVDLSGYTEFGRSGVLSARVAPVQLSYLGFPGTMGNAAVDGIVADAFLIPPRLQHLYDEPVVALAHCYQASPTWPAPGAAPDRSALGLPNDAFVFCCFNNPYKIRPALFDAWMRLLQGTPGSVLWLAAFNDRCRDNLRREAQARRVDAQRLVFAPLVSFAEHAARLPAADLFLDTHPYSAGATANQTLGCGVPMLTLAGESYVSRMAGSLLHALELPELIAFSLDEYEDKAMQLVNDPHLLMHCRARLRDTHARARLFDPRAGAGALEAAYLVLTGRVRAKEGHRAC